MPVRLNNSKCCAPTGIVFNNPKNNSAGSGSSGGSIDATAIVNAINNQQSSSVEVEKCWFIDDVNGDGSDLVPFVRATLVCVEKDGTITSNELGDFTDMSLASQYDVVGGATASSEVGTDAETKLDHIVLKDGDTWSPGPLVHAFDAAVIAGEPTVDSSNAAQSSLITGQSVHWSRTQDAPLDDAFTITARAGTADCVSIAVNSLGAS